MTSIPKLSLRSAKGSAVFLWTERLKAFIASRRSVLIDLSFLVSLSLVLVIIWFQEGLMIGGGDIGLPFYRPIRIFEIVRYIWWGEIAPGMAFSRSINTIPFYSMLSALSFIGLPDFAIQALVFFVVLVGSGSSVYLITLIFIDDNRTRRIAGILAALFYMLNPFSLVAVWHRFDPPTVVFMVLLPLSLLLTIKALKGKRIFLPAFTIALLTVVFSYSFSSPAFVLTFWIVLLSYPIFHIIKSRGANFLHTAKFVAFLVVLFLALNLWWIAPFYYEYLIPSVLSSYGGAGGQTLGFYGVFDVSRLFDRYYLALAPLGDVPYEHGHFGLIYTTPLFQLISFMIPTIAFTTFLFKRNDRAALYFTVLSVFGIFLAKGAAPPVGELMQWLVGNFLIFGPLRSAFHKLGFIVVLGYSYLFSVGFASLYAWLRGHSESRLRPSARSVSRRVIAMGLIGVVCFSFFGVYQWPMWTGDVFRRGDAVPDYRVKVPSYYDEAREWLSTQPDGRIIAMPFQGIMTYTWPPYGYHGVESSEWLFNRPVLGKWISVSHFDQIVYGWRKLYSTNQMWKFMNLFGARFVMVRHDINYTASQTDNPADIELAMRNLLKPISCDLALDCDKFSVLWGLNGRISLDESGILSFEAVPEGDDRQLGFSYSVPQNLQDWNNIPYLAVRLSSNTVGDLLCAVLDNVGHGINWDGRYDIAYKIPSSDVGRWKTFMLDTKKPTAGYLNKSAVTHIMIAITNAHASHVELKISNLAMATSFELVPNPHISYVKSMGELDLYELDEAYFLDKIYATNKIAFSSDAYTMLEMMDEPSFIPGDTLVFLDSQHGMSDYSFLTSLNADAPPYKPCLSFRQIDPTHYEVNIVNATQPFFLFFGETYHPLWAVSTQDTGVIQENRHFIMNGYGNAWYINKTGTYKLNIKFSLQTIFNYCVIASVFVLFLCLSYLMHARISKLVTVYIKARKKFSSPIAD